MVLQTMMSSKGYKLKEDAKFKILETKLILDLTILTGYKVYWLLPFSSSVNTLATSPTDDDDVILNHVPLSPSSTIPPNSPGTPTSPGTPVTPVTPGVVTKINLVIAFQVLD